MPFVSSSRYKRSISDDAIMIHDSHRRLKYLLYGTDMCIDRPSRIVVVEKFLGAIQEIENAMTRQTVRGYADPILRSPEVDVKSSWMDLLLRLQNQADAARTLADAIHLVSEANNDERNAVEVVKKTLKELHDGIMPVILQCVFVDLITQWDSYLRLEKSYYGTRPLTCDLRTLKEIEAIPTSESQNTLGKAELQKIRDEMKALKAAGEYEEFSKKFVAKDAILMEAFFEPSNIDVETKVDDVQQYGDVAVDRSSLTFKRPDGEKTGWCLTVWVKEDEQWKIRHTCNTVKL